MSFLDNFLRSNWILSETSSSRCILQCSLLLYFLIMLDNDVSSDEWFRAYIMQNIYTFLFHRFVNFFRPSVYTLELLIYITWLFVCVSRLLVHISDRLLAHNFLDNFTLSNAINELVQRAFEKSHLIEGYEAKTLRRYIEKWIDRCSFLENLNRTVLFQKLYRTKLHQDETTSFLDYMKI